MNLRAVLGLFGALRRGRAVEQAIINWGHAQEPPIHFNGLRHARTLDELLEISHDEVRQLGELVDKERELTDRYRDQLLYELGLVNPQLDFSPRNTRDRFDILGEDAAGACVVVEIKRADGERRAVEQLMRYFQHLRKDPRYEGREVRGVLVTGRADTATRRALVELRGSNPECVIEWWLYGIKDGELRITIEPF